MAKPVTLDTINYRQNAMFWSGVVFSALVVIALIVIAVIISVYNSQNVKYISNVGPDGSGEITLIAGLGEAILTNTPNPHDITIANVGVVTVNSLNADAGGNLIIDVTAPGLSVANVGNTVTLTNEGVTSLIAGAGIAVAPGGGTGAVTVSNTGVITVNNLAADLAGNIVLAVTAPGLSMISLGNTVTFTNGGVVTVNGLTPALGDIVVAVNPGLSVASAGNTVTLTNDGVLTLNGLSPVAGDVVVAASDGLSAASAGNTVTVTDLLTTQTLSSNFDAAGAVVDYTVFIGFFVPVPENTWRTGLAPGFPSPFLPGSFDDGQGNVGGVAWAVPATGTYQANVDCEVIPGSIAPGDHQSATVALCLGAISEDPLAAGRVPMGGYATLDLSAGATAGVPPALNRRISLATTFQAGCPSCLVLVGQSLTLHVRQDHTGVAPPVLADFVCRMQVTRIK